MTLEMKKHHAPGSNPLEHFLSLGKELNGAAAASELVYQALEAPGLNIFSELMDLPGVKELENLKEFKSSWDLLKIFAYGTYKDYTSWKVPLGLPDLSPGQTKKLKYLTIVTLSIKEKCIPYSSLQAELDISDVRELEDLIIEAIYAEIFKGKLNPSRGVLEIDDTIARDIRKEDVTTIVSTLEKWSDTCENVLDSLELQMDRADSEKTLQTLKKNLFEQKIANLKKAVKKVQPTRPRDSDDDEMDIMMAQIANF